MMMMIRRTEDFDNLVLVLMLMSRLSSLRHKTHYANVYAYAYVIVKTRLNGEDLHPVQSL